MRGNSLVAELRLIAPRRLEGQSHDFAFRMDGLSLIDLNAMVNEAADFIESLLTRLSNADARVAEAVAAERERCAKIAERHRKTGCDEVAHRRAAEAIATAIRSDKEIGT